MRSLRDITIGIRLQASVVMAAVALGCVSLPACLAFSEEGGLGFWDVLLGVCPVVALVFTVSVWWSYLHSTRAYGGWVAAATLAIIIPVILYLFLCLATSW